jgi:Domain of unknown function (DUF4349)/Putative zinc-finger
MSRIEHPISQEDLMAFVDGQLPAGDASKVMEHLEDCPECAAVISDATQLSRHLQAWKVEEPPERIGEGVLAELRQRPAGISGPWRRAWWIRGRMWAYGLTVSFAAAMLLLFVVVPSQLRSREAAHSASEGASFGGNSLKIPRGQQGQQGQQGQTRTPLFDRSAPMVIRTISLTLITKEFDAARGRIEGIVTQTQGYIDQLTVRAEPGTARRLSATLRLPSDQVNTGLAELKKLGRLTDESQNSSDITAQYVDLTARLSNARNTEQRLLALLRERTGNLKDVVEVERELASVREGIERMEAQQKDLNNKVQYAAIQLELAEEYRAQLAPPAPSTGAEVRNALVDGIRSAGENALGIVLFLLRYGPTLLMWLIVIGPIAFALWRFRRRIAIF